jgi:Xaa-Pro aminopeptidase
MGAVITNEPGLYMSDVEGVPEKYKGIGVRIEDDVLVLENGNEVLTAEVPKRVDDIVRLMRSRR